MGCGRIGARVAVKLSDQGNIIQVLDVNPDSFRRLPRRRIENGRIVPHIGDGTIEADHRKAAANEADVFMALSGSDSVNVLGAQIARHLMQVPVVICLLDDPVMAETFEELGLITVCSSDLIVGTILETGMS